MRSYGKAMAGSQQTAVNEEALTTGWVHPTEISNLAARPRPALASHRDAARRGWRMSSPLLVL